MRVSDVVEKKVKRKQRVYHFCKSQIPQEFAFSFFSILLGTRKPFLVVAACKCDQEDARTVTREEAQIFAVSIGAR